MAAEKGNNYYTLRKDVPALTPEELKEKAIEYFDYCVNNPIITEEIFNTKLGIERIEVRKVRVFTLRGMFMFIGIGKDTFYRYENDDSGKYRDITTHIRDVIFTQKYENAAAGTIKESFIAKDILIDKKDVTSDGKALQKNVISFGGKEFEI